jgi:LA2681-like HEPN
VTQPTLSNLLLEELRDQGLSDYRVALKRIEELSVGATPKDLCHLAGVLIDLAIPQRDLETAKRAVLMIEDYEKLPSAKPEVTYMLGTAYGALSQCDPARDASWAERHRDSRRTARRLLHQAAINDATETDIRCQALINLGHEFYRSARWIEAYDAYRNALGLQPGHPVAAGWLSKVIFDFRQNGGLVSPELQEEGKHLAWQAQLQSAEVRNISSDDVVRQFAKLPSAATTDRRIQPNWQEDSYEAFVSDNRLHLSFSFDAADPTEWDMANFVGTVTIETASSPPRIVAFLNCLKEDYLVARRLAYEAVLDDRLGAKEYADTCDGARYGSEPAKLRLAMRSAQDCLDRIGVAANEYFSLGDPPDRVTFRNLWRHSKTHELRPALLAFYDADRWPIVSLVELAYDYEDGGYLYPLSAERNAATHRFLRASLTPVPPVCKAMADRTFYDLGLATIRSLHVTRTALLNFCASISTNERQRWQSDPKGTRVWGRGSTHP